MTASLRQAPKPREIFVTAILLAYVGGAVLFWVHAILRAEPGPPISILDHWLLDSSIGFVALAPVLFLIMPRTARLHPSFPKLVPVATGVIFALVTMPGPIMHDLIVGRGTPGGEWAALVLGTEVTGTELLGPVPPVTNSALSECVVQLLVGLPTYLLLIYVAEQVNTAISFAGRRMRTRRFLR